MAGKPHRRRHIGYNPAMIGAVAAIRHDYIYIAVLDFPVKFCRFSGFVPAKTKRDHVIPFYIKKIFPVISR